MNLGTYGKQVANMVHAEVEKFLAGKKKPVHLKDVMAHLDNQGYILVDAKMFAQWVRTNFPEVVVPNTIDIEI
jgi:hypothetical protein